MVRDGLLAPMLEVVAMAAQQEPEPTKHGLGAPHLAVDTVREGFTRFRQLTSILVDLTEVEPRKRILRLVGDNQPAALFRETVDSRIEVHLRQLTLRNSAGMLQIRPILVEEVEASIPDLA